MESLLTNVAVKARFENCASSHIVMELVGVEP